MVCRRWPGSDVFSRHPRGRSGSAAGRTASSRRNPRAAACSAGPVCSPGCLVCETGSRETAARHRRRGAMNTRSTTPRCLLETREACRCRHASQGSRHRHQTGCTGRYSRWRDLDYSPGRSVRSRCRSGSSRRRSRARWPSIGPQDGACNRYCLSRPSAGCTHAHRSHSCCCRH